MLAVGGWSPEHSHTEIMDLDLQWTDVEDYPSDDYVSNVAPIYHDEKFYVFGNHWDSYSSHTSIYALSCSTWTWKLVGNLKVSFLYHLTIIL